MGGARCAQVNGGINYLLSILDLQLTLRVTGVIFYLVLLIPLGVYGICLWVSLAKKKKKRHYLHPDLAELARLNNAKKDPEQ